MNTVTETTKAEALRALADWVEQHPEVRVSITAGVYVYDKDEAAEALAAAAPFDTIGPTESTAFPIVFVRHFGSDVHLDVQTFHTVLDAVEKTTTTTVFEVPEELAAIAEGRS